MDYMTIGEVIKQGKRSINSVSIASFILFPLIASGLCLFFLPASLLAPVLFASFILGFLFSWIWWSYRIVKWRIWAFRQVRKSEWPRLKKRAIKALLIWNDGSIFEKTEFRNRSEAAEIDAINLAIGQIEAHQMQEGLQGYKDDGSLPETFEILFKRSTSIVAVITPIALLICAGITGYFGKVGFSLFGVAGAWFYFDLNKIKNLWGPQPQIVMNKEGISVKAWNDGVSLAWEDAEDMGVDTAEGKFYLSAWRNEKLHRHSLDLNEYDLADPEDFLRILSIYLGRSDLYE